MFPQIALFHSESFSFFAFVYRWFVGAVGRLFMMSEYVCIKLLTLYVYLSIPPLVFLFLFSFYSKGLFSLFLSVSQLIISIPLCLLLFPYSCVCIFCFFFFSCFFSFLSFFFISTSPMLTQLVSHFISHLFLRAY